MSPSRTSRFSPEPRSAPESSESSESSTAASADTSSETESSTTESSTDSSTCVSLTVVFLSGWTAPCGRPGDASAPLLGLGRSLRRWALAAGPVRSLARARRRGPGGHRGVRLRLVVDRGLAKAHRTLARLGREGLAQLADRLLDLDR